MLLFGWCGRSIRGVVPSYESDSPLKYYSNLAHKQNHFIDNDAQDVINANLYNLTVKRYRTLMRTRGMNIDIMNTLYENGWDFNDTSQDIFIMAFLNNPVEIGKH